MKFEHLEHTKTEFIKTVNSQANKGMKTYGQPLDPYESGRDWDDMGAEELADAFTYNRAAKTRRILAIDKIRGLTDSVEINFWLDFLEGK